MKNLILTTLSDSRHHDYSAKPEVDVFLHSAGKIPNTDLAILSDKLNRNIPHITCQNSSNIMLDRWAFFYNFLCKNNYDQVLIADSRDVLFQSDPFNYSNGKVILSGEGLLHEESEWNTAFQLRNLQSKGLAFDIKKWPVVNGGVVMGPLSKVRDYCLLIYTNSHSNITDTDQPTINLLWNTLLNQNPDYMLADPKKDTFCLTGDTLKQNLINVSREPYAIFHQWDRTHYSNEILATYKKY